MMAIALLHSFVSLGVLVWFIPQQSVIKHNFPCHSESSESDIDLLDSEETICEKATVDSQEVSVLFTYSGMERIQQFDSLRGSLNEMVETRKYSKPLYENSFIHYCIARYKIAILYANLSSVQSGIGPQIS